MFAEISERKMRVVRGLLVLGWIAIIGSLFWDPVTTAWTQGAALGSPFRVATGTVVEIQDRLVKDTPYAMGSHIFWTMVLPLVPAFLLVFGHSAWRRICPLSAVMQIPRRLGIQRRRFRINPKTGLPEHTAALVKAESWLDKNHWLLQFGLLWVAVSARIVFLNSDRMALGIFFVGVIVSAMTVGFLFGGKTWCNYFCPLSPVQKFYTEPRGLLEVSANRQNTPITQSMCRTIDKETGGEKSACVGCKSKCPDIDLEGQYWAKQHVRGRRLFYYGYPGLVIGYFSYYRLYSGNWDYYLSGLWTHESNPLADALGPGFYLWGTAIPIPKFVAAPLTVALCIALTYGIGVVGEKWYQRGLETKGILLRRENLLHRTFALSTYFTFNVFYLFSGRSNIMLLPAAMQTMINMALVAIPTIWLVRTWNRTAGTFERESIAGSLRRQLGKLKMNWNKLLHGRSLDQLDADEVYILAQTLPIIDVKTRQDTYRTTIQEAVEGDYVNTPAGRQVLRDLREQLALSESEHREIIGDFGIEPTIPSGRPLGVAISPGDLLRKVHATSPPSD